MKILKQLKKLLSTPTAIDELTRNFDELRFNQGVILSNLIKQNQSQNLHEHEFRIYSQWGEDGILQRLTQIIPITHQTFIEFGVEDFSESNCRFLLQKDNWQGYVIDGDARNINKLHSQPWFWKYNLKARAAFITCENINSLLEHSGFDHDLGVMSIDLDGNDYHVLQAIKEWKPRILVTEYNAVFGSDRAITVPYDPAFVRQSKHHSCLYAGCSLAAIHHLAQSRGYALVGTNIAGNNAFFVRVDLVNDKVRVLSPQEAFTESQFRESRNSEGHLNFLSGTERLRELRGLPVLNVITGAVEYL